MTTADRIKRETAVALAATSALSEILEADRGPVGKQHGSKAKPYKIQKGSVKRVRSSSGLKGVQFKLGGHHGYGRAWRESEHPRGHDGKWIYKRSGIKASSVVRPRRGEGWEKLRAQRKLARDRADGKIPPKTPGGKTPPRETRMSFLLADALKQAASPHAAKYKSATTPKQRLAHAAIIGAAGAAVTAKEFTPGARAQRAYATYVKYDRDSRIEFAKHGRTLTRSGHVVEPGDEVRVGNLRKRAVYMGPHYRPQGDNYTATGKVIVDVGNDTYKAVRMRALKRPTGKKRLDSDTAIKIARAQTMPIFWRGKIKSPAKVRFEYEWERGGRKRVAHAARMEARAYQVARRGPYSKVVGRGIEHAVSQATNKKLNRKRKYHKRYMSAKKYQKGRSGTDAQFRPYLYGEGGVGPPPGSIERRVYTSGEKRLRHQIIQSEHYIAKRESPKKKVKESFIQEASRSKAFGALAKGLRRAWNSRFHPRDRMGRFAAGRAGRQQKLYIDSGARSPMYRGLEGVSKVRRMQIIGANKRFREHLRAEASGAARTSYRASARRGGIGIGRRVYRGGPGRSWDVKESSAFSHWNPALHPRDQEGKFAPKPGGARSDLVRPLGPPRTRGKYQMNRDDARDFKYLEAYPTGVKRAHERAARGLETGALPRGAAKLRNPAVRRSLGRMLARRTKHQIHYGIGKAKRIGSRAVDTAILTGISGGTFSAAGAVVPLLRREMTRRAALGMIGSGIRAGVAGSVPMSIGMELGGYAAMRGARAFDDWERARLTRSHKERTRLRKRALANAAKASAASALAGSSFVGAAELAKKFP